MDVFALRAEGIRGGVATCTDLHPADEFEAFRRLSEERGLSAEEIGSRFGRSAQDVQQRLRLNWSSPWRPQ